LLVFSALILVFQYLSR